MKSLLLNRISKYAILIFLTSFAWIPLGCGEEETATAPDDDQDTNEIVMQNTAFSPGNLTISVGTTITWINKDNFAHTVTSGKPGAETGLFDSGNLGQNGEFSFTFTQAGTFEYFCKIHPTMMQATIIVQ